MDYEKYINNVVDFAYKKLDIRNKKIEKDYSSLTLCIIDCIYSLRAQYISTTLPIVRRYANAFLNGSLYNVTDTLDDFIKNINESGGCDLFASNILKNMQKSGRCLKSKVCYELARKFILLGIHSLDDFKKYPSTEILEIVIRSVKGIGDAGLNYLFMLAGDENRCKPDVHIHHFIKDACAFDATNDECQIILSGATEILKKEIPELTVRKLDRIIWEKYQINNK